MEKEYKYGIPIGEVIPEDAEGLFKEGWMNYYAKGASLGLPNIGLHRNFNYEPHELRIPIKPEEKKKNG